MSKVNFEYACVSFCFSKIFVKLCPVFEYVHLSCLVILSGSENSASTVAKYPVGLVGVVVGVVGVTVGLVGFEYGFVEAGGFEYGLVGVEVSGVGGVCPILVSGG
ncbi:hypothetical protein P8452_31457 [Trifolium repens]|nr:hypothetical protein P8452_31457 [Trifolium repens]